MAWGLAEKRGPKVSASKWSVWLCELVMTSIPLSRSGAITRSVRRVCGLSVAAYFRVSESDR